MAFVLLTFLSHFVFCFDSSIVVENGPREQCFFRPLENICATIFAGKVLSKQYSLQLREDAIHNVIVLLSLCRFSPDDRQRRLVARFATNAWLLLFVTCDSLSRELGGTHKTSHIERIRFLLYTTNKLLETGFKERLY